MHIRRYACSYESRSYSLTIFTALIRDFTLFTQHEVKRGINLYSHYSSPYSLEKIFIIKSGKRCSSLRISGIPHVNNDNVSGILSIISGYAPV